MSVERLQKYVRDRWVNIASYAAVFTALLAGLLWKLNTLVPGYSNSEVRTYTNALDLHMWLSHPANLPFKALVKFLAILHPHSYLVTRIATVLLAVGVLAIFARLLYAWQDMRTSIIGTLLFGSSAWFLHVARFGTAEIVSFGVFALVASGFWAKQTSSRLALAICFISGAVVLYFPGMIWFVVLGVIWQWKTLDRLFKEHLMTVTLAGLALVAMLAPLVIALYQNQSLILPYLGIPRQIPDTLTILANIVQFPYHVLVHNSANAQLWLGNAPLLDAFSTAMVVLGGYLYIRHARLGRTPVFLSVIGLTVILSAIGSPVSFSVIVPFLYILIAVGTSYLLDTWFMTFPRNPIARSIGWGVMGLMLAIVCFYHVTHYFIGWPQADATRSVFIDRPRP